MGFEKKRFAVYGYHGMRYVCLPFFHQCKNAKRKNKKNNACKTYLLWGNMLSEWAIVL
jgi:hypothetical protein